MTDPPPPDAPVVVLGAGYAGVSVCHAVQKAGRGSLPVTVVDRHPSHTLRTRLYEVDRLAAAGAESSRWSVPIDRVLAHDRATFAAGEIGGVDLAARTVTVDGRPLAFRALAICLGSVAAYYGIPGAAEHTEEVYRLAGARKLAARLKELAGSANRPVRVIVVGGGSTGTELAAEIATARWSRLVGHDVPGMEVTLVIGALPFLAGLPPPLIDHARRLLERAGVRSVPELNVAKVEPGRLTLANGTVLEADVIVWCAGLAAPAIVRDLPVPHGKGGRIAVDDRLEVPGHPGVFAVGDVIELKDPTTGLLVPGTAQAALAEAPVAGANLVAHLNGAPYRSFRYRERGLVVAVGRRSGAGQVAGLSVWGRPAALLKAAIDTEYAASAERGRRSPGL